MSHRRPAAPESGDGGLSTNANGELSSRMSVEEIARRLDIGRIAVYTMLEKKMIPAIRLGRRWIITRHAFEEWERTCGMPVRIELSANPEVKVLN